MSIKLNRQTLSDQAEKVIRQMITSYRFTPGARINVECLAQEMAVSRTPILQALKRLEEEGLIEYQPNRGYLMTEMTPPMPIELYTVRGLLEGMAGRMAATRIDDKSLKKMKKIFNNQENIVNKKQLLEYSESAFAFHDIIYDNCGNWLLQELLNYIRNRARPIQADVTPILEELRQDHLNILEALERRDPDAAEKALIAHAFRMRELIEKEHLKNEAAYSVANAG